MKRSDRRSFGNGKCGQVVILFVMLMLVLVGIAGLAIDGGLSYVSQIDAERAATAAALAGVPYMPGTSVGPPTNTVDPNALDQALKAAGNNGFQDGVIGPCNIKTHVTVSLVTQGAPSPPGYFTNELRVTVSRAIPTYVLGVLGYHCTTISATKTADYLPPVDIGQGVPQIGSTAACYYDANVFHQSPGDCAPGGITSNYNVRTHSWNTGRTLGDAFTPCIEDLGNGVGNDPLNPPTPWFTTCPKTTAVPSGTTNQNYHDLSAIAGTDMGNQPACPTCTAAVTLPNRGGYNYKLWVATGATVALQVYNAAASDRATGKITVSGTNPAICDTHSVSTIGLDRWSCTSYDGSIGAGQGGTRSNTPTADGDSSPGVYSSNFYSLYKVSDVFNRASDQLLNQFLVKGLDANFMDSTTTGCAPVDPNGGATPHCFVAPNGTQSGTLIPVDSGGMHVFQDWINVASAMLSDRSCTTGIPAGSECYGDPRGAAGFDAVRHTDGSLTNPDAGQATTLSGGSQLEGQYYRLRLDPVGLDASGAPMLSASGDESGNLAETNHSYAVRALDLTGGPKTCSAGVTYHLDNNPTSNCYPLCVPMYDTTFGVQHNCNLAAWTDMCFITQIQGHDPAAQFAFQVFRIPTAYHGKTVNVDLWDPGDGAGNQCTKPTGSDPCDPSELAAQRNMITLMEPDDASVYDPLNPSTSIKYCPYTNSTTANTWETADSICPPVSGGAPNVNVMLVGQAGKGPDLPPVPPGPAALDPSLRPSIPTCEPPDVCPIPYNSGETASVTSFLGDGSATGPDGAIHVLSPPADHYAGCFPTGTTYCYNSYVKPFNGEWLRFQLVIPDTYTSNNGYYWELRYTAHNFTAADILTIKVSSASTPVHLLP